MVVARDAVSNSGGIDEAARQRYIDNLTEANDWGGALMAKLESAYSSGSIGLGTKLASELGAIGSAIARMQNEISVQGDDPGGLRQTRLASLQKVNDEVAAKLAAFTTLSAQYGDAVAEQVLALQEWYKAQYAALNQYPNYFPEALSALGQVYQQKFDALTKGISTGVDGTIDALAKLKQGIADYLKGLTVGDLSPLTPMQKLAQAKTALDAEFAKAQGGDQAALGDLTKFEDTYLKLARDAYASGQQYTDIFSSETRRLGDLAGVQSNGQPFPVVKDPPALLAAALPPGGATLASSDDILALRAALVDTQTALADANTADLEQLRAQVAQLQAALVEALDPVAR